MNGIIRIVGSHDHGDGIPEIVKTESEGQCVLEDDLYIITYDEPLKNDDDPRKAIRHRLEIGIGTLSMTQTGILESDMRFGLGKTWHSNYKTPYGVMDMSVITRNLMVETGAKKITAHVQYELQLDGNKVSDSNVRVSFVFSEKSNINN